MRVFTSLTAVAVLALPLTASAQDHCTHETLKVNGTPVTIGYCVTGAAKVDGSEVALPVSETYSSPNGSFARNTTMRFIDGGGPSRVLENADLHPLGVAGTLHLTLVYAGGVVHIENAMLTPGAIPIK